MKLLLYILTVISIFITILFAKIFLQRVGLDYNEEGRYFDPELSLIYTEQAKIVYGIFAVIGLIVTGLLLFIIIRRKKNKQ